MSVEIRKLVPGDLRLIEPHKYQAMEFNVSLDLALESLVHLGPGWTALLDGKIILCAGIMPIWPGRAAMWAALAGDSARHMLPLTRAGQMILQLDPTRRIETYVDCTFAQGQRWVQMLGFQKEAERMRGFGVAGEDNQLWARVRDD